MVYPDCSKPRCSRQVLGTVKYASFIIPLQFELLIQQKVGLNAE